MQRDENAHLILSKGLHLIPKLAQAGLNDGAYSTLMTLSTLESFLLFFTVHGNFKFIRKKPLH